MNEARPISDLPRSIAVVCDAIPASGGLRLRPWSPSDAAVLSDAWDDPEIGRWNPVPPDRSVAFASSWIDGTRTQNVASIGVDVVLVDDSDRVLGEIGLQVDPQRAIAEVGFWLSKEHRGSGHGQHLLYFVVELAQHLDLVGLVALSDSKNSAAIGLLRRCGWVEVPTASQRLAFARRIA